MPGAFSIFNLVDDLRIAQPEWDVTNGLDTQQLTWLSNICDFSRFLSIHLSLFDSLLHNTQRHVIVLKRKKKNPKIMHIWVKSIEQTIAACWVRKKMCAQVLLGLLHTKQTALQMGFKNEKQQQLHSGHTYPQYIHILPCQDTINRYL